MVESEGVARKFVEDECERQNEGLNSFENPFQSWVNEIYHESKMLIKEGTGINKFYSTNLVPLLIKCTLVWSYGTNFWLWGRGIKLSSRRVKL